jgi:hypothetical protein
LFFCFHNILMQNNRKQHDRAATAEQEKINHMNKLLSSVLIKRCLLRDFTNLLQAFQHSIQRNMIRYTATANVGSIPETMRFQGTSITIGTMIDIAPASSHNMSMMLLICGTMIMSFYKRDKAYFN